MLTTQIWTHWDEEGRASGLPLIQWLAEHAYPVTEDVMLTILHWDGETAWRGAGMKRRQRWDCGTQRVCITMPERLCARMKEALDEEQTLSDAIRQAITLWLIHSDNQAAIRACFNNVGP